MKAVFWKAVAVFMAMSSLSACASVDQFGSRIYDGNLNSQNAMNQEILLNIVRASRYQSQNFVAITQVTGGQTETVSTGLPTFGVGPHQTAAEHIYQISNSVQSGFTGGYQSNPLISTLFQSGMLSPVDLRTVALLSASHLREVVYFALFDSITINTSGRRANVARLVNDPTRNSMTGDEFQIDTKDCNSLIDMVGWEAQAFPASVCSYSKFVGFMRDLISFGMISTLVEGSSGGSPSGQGSSASQGSSSSSTQTTGSPGRLCFDPSYASREYVIRVASSESSCGYKAKTAGSPAGTTDTVTKTIKTKTGQTEVDSTNTVTGPPKPKKDKTLTFYIKGLGLVEFTFQLRSPTQVFNYLGAWLRNQSDASFPGYYTRDAVNLLAGDGKYLDVVPLGEAPCYATILYAAQTYCVPAQALHTAMLMDILEDLRNLNINPTDLNSAFTVRLSQQ